MQIIRIDLKFRYFSVQIDYLYTFEQAIKHGGRRTQYKYQLKRCHIGSTLNEITSRSNLFSLKWDCLCNELRTTEHNETQYDITLTMIKRNATQKVNYLIVSSISIRIFRYCRVQTPASSHSRHSKEKIAWNWQINGYSDVNHITLRLCVLLLCTSITPQIKGDMFLERILCHSSLHTDNTNDYGTGKK